MPNRWVSFVKEFASKNNTTYGCALSNPECSQGYKAKYGSSKKVSQNKSREMMGAEDTPAPERKESLGDIYGQPVNKGYITTPEFRKSLTPKGRPRTNTLVLPEEPQAIERMLPVPKRKAGRPKGAPNKKPTKNMELKMMAKEDKQGKGLLEELKKGELGKPTREQIIEIIRQRREREREANNANPMCSPRPTQKGGRKTSGKGTTCSRVSPAEQIPRTRRELNRVGSTEVIVDRRDEDELQLNILEAKMNADSSKIVKKIKKFEKQITEIKKRPFFNHREVNNLMDHIEYEKQKLNYIKKPFLLLKEEFRRKYGSRGICYSRQTAVVEPEQTEEEIRNEIQDQLILQTQRYIIRLQTRLARLAHNPDTEDFRDDLEAKIELAFQDLDRFIGPVPPRQP